MLNARESTAKGVYRGVASNINEGLWEQVVSDEDKALVGAVYREFQDTWESLDLRSPQELWATWGSYEARAEEMFAEAVGVEPIKGVSRKKEDLTEFDNIRSFINLSVKPWSENWPGLNEEQLSKRMSELQIPTEFLATTDIITAARAVGIDLTPGMTGADLYGKVQMSLNEINQTLKTNVDPAYQTYIGSRTAVSRVIDENLRSIMYNQNYAAEWRSVVTDFVDYEARISDRWRDVPLGMPPSEMLEVQDRFMRMMQGADDSVVVDWQQLWEKGFERNYGPLNWTPPEPRIPWDEDGSPVEGAYTPYIHHIIDGDSIVARNSMTGPWHEVRLLGVRARDYGLDDEGADEDKDRLWDALQQAKANGDTIWLVRDAGDFGNVDIYGRELAWLWI
ncbi:MAG: hypothetical protein GWN18_04410, partial [Thermoplasmata archaeon]|nr:hypothetical protein [Thermoplasmata archaeon]NIV28608.1 hypothetical protein [Anaerolineae bacterium]NIS19212.1 hypothetical protein [Thermoplasmata archaeon]NIT76188.1 hypothetical protein [Thermoplasmata archaeon]NIU48347.1 hypothetical protein [Thermoplasmata archaeon]